MILRIKRGSAEISGPCGGGREAAFGRRPWPLPLLGVVRPDIDLLVDEVVVLVFEERPGVVFLGLGLDIILGEVHAKVVGGAGGGGVVTRLVIRLDGVGL